MRSHALVEPIVTKFCVWGRVGDAITDAKFFWKSVKGFRSYKTPQRPFPIINVLHCVLCLSAVLLTRT